MKDTERDQSRIWQHFQAEGVRQFAASHPRLDFLLNQVGRRLPGRTARLLNVGIGDGWLEDRAIERGWSVASLDPDEGAVTRLVERGVDATVGRIETLPFESESFDAVVASEVVEHLTEQQRTAGLAEITRVLRGDGLFVGSVPHAENLFEQTAVCPDCGHVFHRWGHHASFTLDDVRTLLDTLFIVDKVSRSAFVDWRSRGLLGRAKATLRWVLAKFGSPIAVPTIYWIARKRRPAR